MTETQVRDLADSTQPDAAQRNAVWNFVRTAPRKARRAVANGTVAFGKTTWNGVKTIGSAIVSCIPWLAKFAASVGLIVLSMAGLWFGATLVQAVFAIAPVAGYIMMLLFAVQLTAVAIRSIRSLSYAITFA